MTVLGMSVENSAELMVDYEKMGHGIKVYKVEKEVEVVRHGTIIARTKNALLLYEKGHNPVYYIPFKDVPGEYLEATSTKTTCSYKGVASYYNLRIGDETSKDAVWQYAESRDEFKAISDYVAFYPNAIDQINVT